MDQISPADLQYQKDHFNDTQAPSVLVACAISFALAGIAVVLRVLSRRVINAALGKDDYMIFAALVILSFVALSGLELLCQSHRCRRLTRNDLISSLRLAISSRMCSVRLTHPIFLQFPG